MIQASHTPKPEETQECTVSPAQPQSLLLRPEVPAKVNKKASQFVVRNPMFALGTLEERGRETMIGTQSQAHSRPESELKLSEKLSNASFDSVLQQIKSTTERYGSTTSHNSEVELSQQVKHLFGDNAGTTAMLESSQRESTMAERERAISVQSRGKFMFVEDNNSPIKVSLTKDSHAHHKEVPSKALN